MATTQVSSERDVVMRDGTQQYRIITICTDRGDLPDTGVFLMEIVDEGDASSDTFTRVVSIIDFTEYSNDRSAAVAAGASYWRNYAFTKYYADVDVAVAAATAIQDRLNELATDYATYEDDFTTGGTPETFSVPTSDPTYVASLKTAYDTAYTAYQTAVTDQATAQSDKNDADAELTDASDSYEALKAASEEIVKICGNFSTAVGAMGTFGASAATMDTLARAVTEAYAVADTSQVLSTLTDLIAALDNLETGYSSYNTARETFVTATNDASAASGECSAYVSTFNTGVLASASQRLETAKTDVTDKTQALAEADAAVTTTYATLESAYDAVKEVCPDWTPTNAFPPIQG
jgi:hypothetical protein